jgi:hypothetical protein
VTALIDEWMPVYDFGERHQVLVRAPIGIVREALAAWRPQDSPAWRLLLRLRGLGKPSGSLRHWGEEMGFLILADSEDEAVFGQVGRFWAINERGALVSPATKEEFRAFGRRGYARAVMSVGVEAISPRRTRLYTETRVQALDAKSRRRFRWYWLIIRPFSGLLRRSMLAGVAARSKAGAGQRARAKETTQ